jgi:hypothetical protein
MTHSVVACLFSQPQDPRRIDALTTTFEGQGLARNTALAAQPAQNTTDGAIAPVVIARGLADVVVPPARTDAYTDSAQLP